MTVAHRKLVYQLCFSIGIAACLLGASILITGPWSRLLETRFLVYESLSLVQFSLGVAASLFCLLMAVSSTGIIALGIGKSVSVEIFFFAIWGLGMTSELGRLVILWLSRQPANMVLLGLITRLVLFGRYLSLGALFVASIFSVGFKHERIGSAIGILCFVALLFATLQPLNTGVLDSGFLISRGYQNLTRLFEITIIVLTVANYLAAWHIQGSRHFLGCGVAGLLILVSSHAMRGSPLWWSFTLAGPLMIAGTWYYLRSMYDYYLWR